jgi:hypothetical protein
MNQAFQSWRIWVFIQNRLVVGGLLLTALVVFITGAVAGAQSWILSEYAFSLFPCSAICFYLSLSLSLSTHIHPILTFSLSLQLTEIGRAPAARGG